MAIRLSELHGISPMLARTLEKAQLDNSNRLLKAASDPKGRKEVAAKLGVPESEVLKLANRADLARISGIGSIYSDLLEFAGVDTVAELRTRNARNLHTKIKEAAQTHHVRRTPNPATVEDWIEEAKTLHRTITY